MREQTKIPLEAAEIDFAQSAAAPKRAKLHAARTETDWSEIERAVAPYGIVTVPLWRDIAERLIALSMLILASPVMALVALIVRLDSPGPILFRQWRIGTGGKLFRFTKFRTYYTDAKERFPDLYRYQYTKQEVESLHFKLTNDPRATRVGRWLRQSTLDELPNLWHVVTGEMSFVGPRPEIPEMFPYYVGADVRKFTVRPGITGKAQISGRGLLSFRKTVAYDIEYLSERGLWNDIRIVFMTLVKVFLRQGAF